MRTVAGRTLFSEILQCSQDDEVKCLLKYCRSASTLPRILNPLSHWQWQRHPGFPLLCCILLGQASAICTTSTTLNVGVFGVSPSSLLTLPFPVFVLFFFFFSLRCSTAVSRITFEEKDAKVDQDV